MIDHGKVIAEGTPGQLKASVGSGALHVRLLDPDQRPRGRARSLARELGAVHLEPDPAALSAPCADADRGRRGRRRAGAARASRIADFSLGQPSLDEVFLALTGHPAEEQTAERADHRGGRQHEHHARPRAPAPVAEERGAAQGARLDPAPAARRAPLSAALTFGWRGMLKVKHVPEQLLDVTITPVMFVLMFTYLFGGAIAGSTERVPATTSCPGSS